MTVDPVIYTYGFDILSVLLLFVPFASSFDDKL